MQLRLNIRHIERPGQVVEPQDRDQHQDRAEHGVQNKFHRGINPPVVPPDSDQEIHGDKRQFPEKEKEEQVERNKHADHGRLNDQQSDEKSFYVFANGLPGAENRKRRQKCCQQNEKQADAVHAQVIMNVCAGDPVVIFLELILRVHAIESVQQKE